MLPLHSRTFGVAASVVVLCWTAPLPYTIFCWESAPRQTCAPLRNGSCAITPKMQFGRISTSTTHQRQREFCNERFQVDRAFGCHMLPSASHVLCDQQNANGRATACTLYTLVNHQHNIHSHPHNKQTQHNTTLRSRTTSNLHLHFHIPTMMLVRVRPTMMTAAAVMVMLLLPALAPLLMLPVLRLTAVALLRVAAGRAGDGC